MSLFVVLDSGPAGMLTNPKASPENDACRAWLRNLIARGVKVALPEIVDYELRRELLRTKKINGIKRLDALKQFVPYLPITTAAMLKAAENWAYARQIGRPTADSTAIDADVILVAQAILAADLGDELVIATTNPAHLSLFVDARLWQDIQ